MKKIIILLSLFFIIGLTSKGNGYYIIGENAVFYCENYDDGTDINVRCTKVAIPLSVKAFDPLVGPTLPGGVPTDPTGGGTGGGSDIIVTDPIGIGDPQQPDCDCNVCNTCGGCIVSSANKLPLGCSDACTCCKCNVCNDCGGCILENGEVLHSNCDDKCLCNYCLRDGDFNDVIKILMDYNCYNNGYLRAEDLFMSGCTDEFLHGYKMSRTYFQYKGEEVVMHVAFTQNNILSVQWHSEIHLGETVWYEIRFLGPYTDTQFREKTIKIVIKDFDVAYDLYLKIKQCMY